MYSDSRKLQFEQYHLPKLADHDVIEWNRETNTVTKGSQFDDIEALLRLVQDKDEEVPDG